MFGSILASTRQKEFVTISVVALTGIVLASALVRYYLFGMSFLRELTTDNQDQFKCHGLLNSGRWLDANLRNWQPPNCVMHMYDSKDTQTCFRGKRIVFTGDSVVRETFWAMARQMESSAKLPVPKESEKHSDIHVTVSDDIHMDFYWDPYMNSTGLKTVFQGADNAVQPDIVVVGTGLWHAKNLGENGFRVWKNTIDDLAMISHERHQTGTSSELTIFLPLLEPNYPHLSDSRRAITPEELARMNGYLEELSAKRFANVALSFKEMVSGASPEISHEDDGLHLVGAVTAAQSQVLVNLRCNDHLEKKFPFDKTCCAKYPLPNSIQLLFFGLVLIAIPIVYHYQLNGLTRAYIPSESTLLALLALGWVLVYAYQVDRTHLFGKEHKQFSFIAFWVSVFGTLALGYVTATTSEKDQPFLNRDQTDEWKGWMQILILIYHYLGASKISGIYNIIRVLVAMYLFMTGFGHTIFFYKKADYSFKRVMAVLMRLNLLNVVLAYTMDTDYLFYYFSPLVSFWFGVVWITMWVKHERNSDLRFLGIKFLISAVTTTILIKTPGVLEFLFSILRIVARIKWEPAEWRFRLGLDMWIVYIGMIVAMVFVKSAELTGSVHWTRIRSIGLIASAVIIPLFLVFEISLSSKFTYNRWHPFISSLPILGFIILRNATSKLRNTYSTAYAFIGRCSLETFILQFHIWLGADTRGILIVIGPSQWRWLSFGIGTIIFIFMSWKLAAVTGTITDWIIGSQKKTVSSVDVPLVAQLPEEEKLESGTKEEGEDSVEELPPPVSSVRQLLFQEKLVRVVGILWEDLRVRAGTIIFILWLLNIVPPFQVRANKIYP
jgi:N-acetylneuraminate 9-O-acetyltransferase